MSEKDQIHGLSGPECVRAAAPSVTADGTIPGLALRVAKGGSASFVYRYRLAGRQYELGCGSCDRSSADTAAASLVAARKRAKQARSRVQDGVNPVEQRREDEARNRDKREAQAAASQPKSMRTLGAIAEHAHRREGKRKRWRNAHAANEWLSSIQRHAAALWDRDIATIGTADVARILDKMAREGKLETARRLRQRLEVVFNDAVTYQHIEGATNPALLLRKHLPPAPREHADDESAEGHHASLEWTEMPAFIQMLRTMPGTGANALEFGILTAARTREILGARWDEIDDKARIWTVPADRMKAHRIHRVPLSDAALRVLARQRGQDDELIFPSLDKRRKDANVSNMTMLALLGRMGLRPSEESADSPEYQRARAAFSTWDGETKITAHGLCRASFMTWAAESEATLGPIARFEVRDACLAHTVASSRGKVAGAYERATHLDERRQLMAAWAEYLEGAAK